MKTTVVVDIHKIKGVKPEYDIYIGRANHYQGLKKSKWANPYTIGKHGDLEEVLARYTRYVISRLDLLHALPELHGKRLGCWCKNKHACHGDVLIELLYRFYPLLKENELEAMESE